MCYENGFKKFNLEKLIGKFIVLFFYPYDFSFVCPTEIVAFSDASDEFRKINCEIVGVSSDSHFVHSEFCKKPKD